MLYSSIYEEFLKNRPFVGITTAFICGILLFETHLIPLILIILFIPILLYLLWSLKEGGLKDVLFFLFLVLSGYIWTEIWKGFDLTGQQSELLTPLKNYFHNILTAGIRKKYIQEFVDAIFLGERRALSKSLVKTFKYTNTFHILSISGLHVGIISGFIIGILRMFTTRKGFISILSIGSILLYASLIGWKAPVTRSTIMFSILIIGWTINRPVDNVNSLFFAGFIILLLSPQTLFKPGFQLSFIIVLALLLSVPLVKVGKYFRLKQFLVGNLTAYLTSLPLIGYYYGIISPLSIAPNLILIPLTGLTLALSLSSVVCGFISIYISLIFNIVNSIIIDIIIGTTNFFYHLPLSYIVVGKFPGIIVFLWYILLIGFFLHLKVKISQSSGV